MIARLIRIYTPFICALAALIHGVLSLIDYDGYAYYILSDISGHSLLLLAYVVLQAKECANGISQHAGFLSRYTFLIYIM